MFCPSCGKEAPGGSTFCPQCGKPIQSVGSQRPAERKSKVLLGILAGVLGLVAVVLAAVVISNQAPNPASNRAPAARHEPVLRPVSEKLTSGQLTVRAGKYAFFKFKVDPAVMRDARVVGAFRASGGSGNDIQVVIAPEDEFENWINGHQSRVLCATEKETNGKIDVSVTEAATYYLAFSNAFSALSDKDVFADVELVYRTPQ